MRDHRLRVLLVGGTLLAVVLASACGSGGGGAPPESPTPFVSNSPRDQEDAARRWVAQLCPLAKEMAGRLVEYQTTFAQIDLTKGPPTKDAVLRHFKAIQSDFVQYHQTVQRAGAPKTVNGAAIQEAFNGLFRTEDAELRDAIAKIEKMVPSPGFGKQLEEAFSIERTYSLGSELEKLSAKGPDVGYVTRAMEPDKACIQWFFPARGAQPGP